MRKISQETYRLSPKFLSLFAPPAYRPRRRWYSISLATSSSSFLRPSSSGDGTARAARRIRRTSSSIDQPFSAARSLSARFSLSSMPRMVSWVTVLALYEVHALHAMHAGGGGKVGQRTQDAGGPAF